MGIRAWRGRESGLAWAAWRWGEGRRRGAVAELPGARGAGKAAETGARERGVGGVEGFGVEDVVVFVVGAGGERGGGLGCAAGWRG